MSDGAFPQASEDVLPVVARGVQKSYVGGDGGELRVLKGVDLEVRAGEAVAILGASGAGKSTLLHLLGAVAGLEDEELAAVRNRYVGFVFQFHHLLREFDALENVMMPALLAGASVAEARDRAKELLAAVGVEHRNSHKPRQLSGGEQQRVAVARALVNHPLVLLADEPSGNLDTHTSQRLHDLLFDLKEERRLCMVIVTHNRDLGARADRSLLLADGRLQPMPQG
jgi:lipoprotein-releasing system ATP-binding protein